MRWIEMMGPPGVGKTTLWRLLREAGDVPWLRRTDVARLAAHRLPPVHREPDGAAVRLRDGLRWPRFAEALGGALVGALAVPVPGAAAGRGAGVPDGEWLFRCAGSWRVLLEAARLAALPGTRPVLVDELLAQRGLVAAFAGAADAAVARIYEHMPRPAAVIVPMAGEDVVRARNRARAERGEDRDLGALWPAAVRAVAIGREVLAARGVPVIEVAAEGAPAAVAAETARRLVAAIGARSGEQAGEQGGA